MSLSIDHLVILVKDLEQAVADYIRLGFQVTPGGEHTDGATHNALIAFQDGSYLELIAFKRPAPEHRWWRHTAVGTGEGLIDFALLPTDIAQTITELRGCGPNYAGPFPGGRLRPDGQEIRWQTGLPPSADLPFLCADVTPRSLRVPFGPAQQHLNGTTGINTLWVMLAPLLDYEWTPADAGLYFWRLLDQQVPTDGEGLPAFQLSNGLIQLVTSAGMTVGPSALSLNSIQQYEVDLFLTHNVRLEING